MSVMERSEKFTFPSEKGPDAFIASGLSVSHYLSGNQIALQFGGYCCFNCIRNH